MTPAPVHSGRAHALLGASSCDRWWNCPGSPRLIEALPRAASSIWAAQGTAFHQLMEWCLRTHRPPQDFKGRIETVDDHRIEIDDEMVAAAETALDALSGMLGPGMDKDDIVLIEVRFSLDPMSPPAPMFGTADLVVWRSKSRRLVVIDFKYGQGVAVEVEDNPQLSYYALGAMLARPQWRPRSVEMMIVQPRAYHRDGPVRSTVMSADDLLEWSVYLFSRAKATTAPDAPINPGDWCRWCPALATCPAQATKALAVARTEFRDLDDDGVTVPRPDSLTAEQIAHVLNHAGLFQDWLNAVRAHATAEINAGRDIPGYMLVPKKANRKWRDEAEVAAVAATVLGLVPPQLYEPAKLKSPAQLEKLVGRKAFAAVSSLITQESSGNNLARIDGSTRPPAAPRITTEFEVLND